MNSCPDRESIAAYVDRRLADSERDAVEAHLAACADCRAEVVALSALVAQVAASTEPVAALRSPLRARRWGPAVAAGLAAAALLAIGLLLRHGTVENLPGTHVSVPPKRDPQPEVSTPEQPNPGSNRSVFATLKDVQGQVWLMLGHQDKRKPGALDDELLPGYGLFTHNGSAVLAYSDGTTVEIGASTWIQRLTESDGKRLHLSEGTVRATVAKQPEGKPFILVTPHGDARVVGTILRLTAAKTGTHLEVEEGKVQLKGVDVAAGQVAFAAPGAPPVLREFSSLRAHWKLDEGSGRIAVDATGLGNDATLKEKTEWSSGKLGGGIECRKAGFYVTGFHPGAPPYTGFTTAFWIRHEELDDWQDVYFSTQGFSIVREGNLERGRIRVMFRSDETSPNLSVNAVVRPGEWMHLALAWDGETARLYRNGLEVGSGRVTGVMPPPQSVSMGAEVDGKMDDIRFYRRALPPEEIARVMNGGEVR
jgi:ferric-dicitrate binding protein FerR (iron transport regulator)